MLTQIRARIEAGWIQGSFSRDGCSCLAGAVILTCLSDFEAKNRIMKQLADLIGGRADPEYVVINWNDEPGRTKQQVLDLIDRALN